MAAFFAMLIDFAKGISLPALSLISLYSTLANADLALNILSR
jgi:hypothetical protein